MAAVTVPNEAARADSPDWARKYPPLLVLALALVVISALLPSALNLPQANPETTQEYAPVPPSDEQSTDDGNQSSLGLGKSSSIKGEGASGGEGGGGLLPDNAVDSSQDRGTDKRCFKHPDGATRQTEDPLSPPCVAVFRGDNFGATYQGVTAKEVRAIVYIEGNIQYTSGSDVQNRNSPSDKCYDLLQQPKPEDNEHLMVTGLRVWQKYFNDRFQTYKRTVHFFACFSSTSPGDQATPEQRRADAAKQFAAYKPFATISFVSEGNEDSYLTYMARKGVLNFGSFSLREASFFQSFPKLIWSYYPSIEQHAGTYISYICDKAVKNNQVVLSDNPGQNGQKRVFGMIHTSDKNRQGLLKMAAAVKEGVRARGADLQDKNIKTHPECCLAQDNRETPTYAATGIAQMQQNGVTTVLWPGGMNGSWGKAAEGANFRPEWIVLGDGLMDANNPVRLATLGPTFDGRAIVVSPETFKPALEQQRCYLAFREVDTSMPRTDLGYVCELYTNLFQFFVGVQVAGPRLGPTSVDKGFHAIPQRKSGNPQVPACYYLPGDYTCVKDAEAEIWDNAGAAPGDNRPGCWRAIEGGARYLAKQWPAGNTNAQIKGNEPCNGFSASVTFYPYPV